MGIVIFAVELHVGPYISHMHMLSKGILYFY